MHGGTYALFYYLLIIILLSLYTVFGQQLTNKNVTFVFFSEEH